MTSRPPSKPLNDKETPVLMMMKRPIPTKMREVRVMGLEHR